MTIYLEPKQLKIIRDILSKYPYQFYAFGSRTKRDHRKYSDLDLCYRIEIPGHIIVELEEEFEESNLPFNVDLINWNNCSKEFQKRIEKDLFPFNLCDT